jgi:hypothetical protein
MQAELFDSTPLFEGAARECQSGSLFILLLERAIAIKSGLIL